MRMALADISTESTSRGGTMIGDAIRTATEEVFDKSSRQYKDLILITDEIYERILYDGRQHSSPGSRPRVTRKSA